MRLIILGNDQNIIKLFFYIMSLKSSNIFLFSKSMTDQEQPPSPNILHNGDISDSESSLSSLHSQQLETMFMTLRKFKRIAKEGQLTSFKKTHPKVNNIFGEMSQFFHFKKNHIEKQKALHKTLRRKMRQQQFHTKVNQKRQMNQLPQFQNTQEEKPQQQMCDKQAQPKMVCFICKDKYQDVHPFYGFFCQSCSELNMAKRIQTADLSGLTALVTGGRIKIGFEIAVKLLRDGASVYVSSRFPQDTLLRYRILKDYSKWSQRLHIIECDFLSQSQVTTLITTIKQRVKKLDILINNAAQTIVRPKQFYFKEIQNQQLMLEPSSENTTTIDIIRSQTTEKYPSVYTQNIRTKPQDIDLERLDEFGQPTDKRISNSWVQDIKEVPILQCLTTQVINSIVPFQLISQLADTMKGDSPSWIINVSSMEGVFNRFYKSPFHPHTNMSKAALNMITRTSSQQLAKNNVFMNSVDTGWVTNQNPWHVSQHMAGDHLFKCPLDCLDGAMRVLDPIYRGVTNKEFPFGLFLKNYRSSAW